MSEQLRGYVPPTGYTPPVEPLQPVTPKDVIVSTPSLDKKGDMSVADFKAYMEDYSALDRVAKQIKEKQDAIKAIVFQGLKDLGLDTAKTDYGTFSVVGESTTERFDAKTFKEESPKIYNLYVVPSVKKSYLKVTPKAPKK